MHKSCVMFSSCMHKDCVGVVMELSMIISCTLVLFQMFVVFNLEREELTPIHVMPKAIFCQRAGKSSNNIPVISSICVDIFSRAFKKNINTCTSLIVNENNCV